jgi:hypothetical protein
MVGSLLRGDLQDLYKKGTINLKAMENFGENNDWEGLFYDPYKEMIIAPDGSIFVANDRQHNISKFDKQGNFLKTFGQKGEGPGDVYHPGDLTILDNKYLVVGDYGLRRRITIWNLDGKCIKVVRTKKYPFHTTAVRNNKLAYLTYSQHAEKWNGYQKKHLVMIKDIDSGMEKILQEITLLDRSSIIVGKSTSFSIGNFFGDVYLAKTIDGNLAVGISNQPRINIYSPAGEKILSFNLKIRPIPVDEKYIKKFKDNYVAKLKSKDEKTMNRTEKYWHDIYMKTSKTLDFSTIFDKHLPLYKEILVDSEGNFLVFLYSDCVKNCKTYFQVYSKQGEFICETELDKGDYDVEIDRRFKNICFTEEGIIGLFMEHGDEDEIIKLVKSKFPVNVPGKAH